MDLNYLGSAMQQNSMPAAALGGSGTPASFLDAAPVSPVSGPAAPGGMALPPFLAGLAGGGMPQYSAVTQQDGTVLLHLQNPDGSLGPAVQIIKPTQPGGNRGKR